MEEDAQKVLELALGLKMPITDRLHMVVDEYTQWIEKKTKKVFSKVRYLDQWNINAQVMLLTMWIVPPLVFFAYWLIMMVYITIYNLALDLTGSQTNQQVQN